MQKKTFRKVIAGVLVLTLAMTGIGAYFTSSDTKNDSYTIGQVEVELVGDNNLYAIEDLTPRYEYEFTRSVKNIGINDAYVFMTVTIPYETASLHNADGNTIIEDADVQLFKYGYDGVAGVSSEWKLVDAGKYADLDLIEMANSNILETSDVMGAVDVNGKTVTYVYGYIGDNADGSLKALSADAETAHLFDTMKLANVTDANMEDTNGLIKTRAFAIQTLNVLETTYMQGNNTDGSADVNAVWAVLNNAAVSDGEISSASKNVHVTAKDENGNDLNASATVIEGEEKEELLEALDNQGLANKEEVDLLIDVKSDEFEDLADTTIDVSEVAEAGDTVIILHYNEETGEWEYINTDTVDSNGTVGGDFSSFSPVAIIVIPKQETSGAGLYDANDNLLISWEDLTSTEYQSLTYYTFNEAQGYGFMPVTSPILNVDENGMLSGTYDSLECMNLSADYLKGSKLVIADDVKVIDDFAFSGCSELETVVLPEGLETIYDYAFENTNVSSLTIPASVTMIANGAFSGCDNLTTLVVNENNTVYDSRNSCNAIVETASNKIVAACNGTSIPVGIESIGDHAFMYCKKLTTISIPDTVTSIGRYAFFNCYGLQSITIPNSVTSIEESTFSNCQSLVDVNIPESVVSIGYSAFNGCESLETITIPNSEAVFKDNYGMYFTFSNCPKLTTIYYAGTSDGAPWGADNATIVTEIPNNRLPWG